MKKIILVLFVVLSHNAHASGWLVPTPVFKVFYKFDYFIKAEVIKMDNEVDSLGNTKISLVLLVKESFTQKIDEDTVYLKLIEYNNDEIWDSFQKIFMDIELYGEYYFGLEDGYSLSPYHQHNKIEIEDDFLDYRCFSNTDLFLMKRIKLCGNRLYRGRKMHTEKFEKKIRKKYNRIQRYEKEE